MCPMCLGQKWCLVATNWSNAAKTWNDPLCLHDPSVLVARQGPSGGPTESPRTQHAEIAALNRLEILWDGTGLGTKREDGENHRQRNGKLMESIYKYLSIVDYTTI